MSEEASLVATGLGDVVLPSETPPEPAKEAQVEAVAEQPTAEPDALITIAEPPAPAVELGPLPEAPAETARDKAEREYHEKAQARIRQFEANLRKANLSEVIPPKPQPIAPAILEQTNREMEAGRKMNEYHDNLKANRPPPKLSVAEIASQGTSIPVFRPDDGKGSKEQNHGKFKTAATVSPR